MHTRLRVVVGSEGRFQPVADNIERLNDVHHGEVRIEPARQPYREFQADLRTFRQIRGINNPLERNDARFVKLLLGIQMRHGQNRYVQFAKQTLRYRSKQHALEIGTAARPHDDEIDLVLINDPKQFLADISRLDDDLKVKLIAVIGGKQLEQLHLRLVIYRRIEGRDMRQHQAGFEFRGERKPIIDGLL